MENYGKNIRTLRQPLLRFSLSQQIFSFLSVFRKNASSATSLKKFGASYSKFTVHWSVMIKLKTKGIHLNVTIAHSWLSPYLQYCADLTEKYRDRLYDLLNIKLCNVSL